MGLTTFKMDCQFIFHGKLNGIFQNLLKLLLFLGLGLTLSSCASTENPLNKITDYISNIEMSDILPEMDGSPLDRKEKLSKKILNLKNMNFIFSPLITLQDLKKTNMSKNKFFLTGEIYSKNPEEPIDSLSEDNCFYPNEQASIKNLDRMFQLFLKDLGLNSTTTSDMSLEGNTGANLVVQPVLLKYHYCERAYVEIQYLTSENNGNQAAKVIKASHRANGFDFPESDEKYPFFNYDNPKAQFLELRHALTVAFHKNTLNFLEVISEGNKSDLTEKHQN